MSGVSFFQKAPAPKFAVLEHREETNQGGAYSNGALRTAPLNTKVSDEDNIVTLDSNQFVLIAGTYEIDIECVLCQTNNGYFLLRDTTNNVDVGVSSVFSAPASLVFNFANTLSCFFVSTGVEELEIQVETTNTSANGFGRNFSYVDRSFNVFRKVVIKKVG